MTDNNKKLMNLKNEITELQVQEIILPVTPTKRTWTCPFHEYEDTDENTKKKQIESKRCKIYTIWIRMKKPEQQQKKIKYIMNRSYYKRLEKYWDQTTDVN